VNYEKCNRSEEYNPEPFYPGPAKYKRSKADKNKRIEPKYIKVHLHLLVIGKKVKEYH
jgi:hypothetical protein